MGLTLTERQFEYLADETLIKKIIGTLREKFPTEIDVENPKQLSAVVHAQMVLAREYGLVSEYAVATFVATAWTLGLGFDKKIPAVSECLAREDMSEEEKALWLEQFTVLIFSTLAEG